MKNGKKIFKIEYKNEAPSLIRFYLNSGILFSEGDYDSTIRCAKYCPFDTGKVGDYIEVDLDKICCIRSRDTIYDNDTARILNEKVAEEIRKSQVKLYELKKTKDGLVPMLNNFSQKIINENFFDFNVALGIIYGVDEFAFDEVYLPVGKRKFGSIVNKFEELKREKNNLERERNEGRTKYYNKDKDYGDCKERYENIQKELSKLQNERINENRKNNDEKLDQEKKKSNLQNENTKLRERLESSNSRVIDLTRRLENREEEVRVIRQEKENQAVIFENKLDQKQQLLETTRQSLEGLKIKYEKEKAEKNNELKEKDKEIERLKKGADLSREELLKEKMRSEKENLEFFAVEIKADLEQIHSLSKYHERLFQAQKKHNQANIETHESNIARAKQELLEKKKISILNIQEICRKCQRIAELSGELEETRQKQAQMNDWKNINSNFTPELVQEGVNHGFTYEQCRDWINTVSPGQQNRAIKEPAYYAWLRDVKKVDAEGVLNKGNEKELGQEFFQGYQEQQKQQFQAQQEQPTK